MPSEFVSIDPLTLAPGPRYGLLAATVQPRPIALVSTVGSSGTANLAPFSFFMAGGSNPPSLMVSVARGADGEPKDSLRNIEETREFVVNLVVRAMADGMNASSFGFPEEFDEWQVSGFHPLASELVRPTRVAESPIHFECRLYDVLRHGDGLGSANYVVGEIVRLHVRPEIWDGERVLDSAFRPIARLGGTEYLDLRELEIFSLPRPSGPADSSVSS